MGARGRVGCNALIPPTFSAYGHKTSLMCTSSRLMHTFKNIIKINTWITTNNKTYFYIIKFIIYSSLRHPSRQLQYVWWLQWWLLPLLPLTLCVCLTCHRMDLQEHSGDLLHSLVQVQVHSDFWSALMPVQQNTRSLKSTQSYISGIFLATSWCSHRQSESCCQQYKYDNSWHD